MTTLTDDPNADQGLMFDYIALVLKDAMPHRWAAVNDRVAARIAAFLDARDAAPPAETPSPEPDLSEPALDEVAMLVYAAMSFEQPKWVPWVPRGNSDAQDRARQAARYITEAYRRPKPAETQAVQGESRRYVSDEESKGEYALQSLPSLQGEPAIPKGYVHASETMDAYRLHAELCDLCIGASRLGTVIEEPEKFARRLFKLRDEVGRAVNGRIPLRLGTGEPAASGVQPSAEPAGTAAKDREGLTRWLDGEESRWRQLAAQTKLAHPAPAEQEGVREALTETVDKAMRLAFTLGQNYWADADSESYAANKRADMHRFKFDDLKAKTLAALAKPAATEGRAPDAEPVPMALSVIRRWPEGFNDRLQHVWLDVVSMIPNVKLFDLQRVLAEFGFRMEVYAPPAGQSEGGKS